MGTTHFSGPVYSDAGFVTGTGVVAPSVTASTLAVTDDYNGQIIPLNRAAGQAVTLPAATGSQAVYTFYVGTAITSNTTTIKVANATDVMQGSSLSVKATSGSTVYSTVAASDTITMDGSTTGGLVGSYIQLLDIGTGFWNVRGILQASGTLATPFSATVS
jgi:hypothetical protein